MKIYSVFEKDIYCNNPVTKGNKVDIYIRDAVDKEIERLWKEKEWLLEAYALDVYIGNDRLDDHKLNDYKNEILKEMQQALKED